MTTIAELATTLQTVLTATAETCARATGAVQRQSKLTGATLVQTLVLGWQHQPQATLGQLAQMAGTLGVGITPQGLEQRFTSRMADCLEQVLAATIREVVVSEPVAIPVLARFSAVTVQDSTSIALPAVFADRWRGPGHRTDPTATTAALLKAQVRCDLCTGRLEGPLLEEGRAQDQAAAWQSHARAPLPAGALRLADLGYFSLVDRHTEIEGSAPDTATPQNRCDRPLGVLQELDHHQVYFLSRLQVQTAVYTRAGQRLDLVQTLRQHDLAQVDLPVCLGATSRLPVRLLAVRVPPAVAAERRRRLHADARHKGPAVSQRRLQGADWTILVTNVPATGATHLTVEEALVLARARWQIELLFKLWKQHGFLDAWRSEKPWRILCEVYAKLIGVVVQHWCLLVSCWSLPDRSLVKAAQTVRSYALLLASAFAGVLPLVAALEHLSQIIRLGRRMNPRKTAPNTYQLLLALEPLAPPEELSH